MAALLGLTSRQVKASLKNYSYSHLLDILVFAANVPKLSGLHKIVDKYVGKSFLQIIHSTEFLNWNEDSLAVFLSLNSLEVAAVEEEKVFDCLISWVEHHPEERTKHLANLIELVRIPFLSQEFIDSIAIPFLTRTDCKGLFSKINEHQTKEQEERKLKPRAGNKLIVTVKGQAVKQLQFLDLQNHIWSYVSLPEEFEPGVRGYKVCVANSRIYIFQDPLNAVVEYDPLVQSFLGYYRMNFNMYSVIVECDNSLYVLTSGHGGVLSDEDEELSNTVEMLDLEDDQPTWRRVPDMQHHGREYFDVAILDGKIYVLGGFDQNFMHLTSVEVYNPQIGQWNYIANMEVARIGIGVGGHNGLLYAIGGKAGDHAELANEYLNLVEYYNPDTDSWTRVADINFPRANAKVVSFNGSLHVLGGYGARGQILDSVEVYCPQSDTWTVVTDPGYKISSIVGKVDIISKCDVTL